MAPAIALVLLGLLGPLAAVQWREGRWLRAAHWIARRLSPQLVAGVPMAGVLLMAIGLSIVWPPGIVLVFLAAGGFLWAVFAVAQPSAETGNPGQARRPSATARAAQRLRRPAPTSRRSGQPPDTRNGPETPGGSSSPPRRSP